MDSGRAQLLEFYRGLTRGLPGGILAALIVAMPVLIGLSPSAEGAAVASRGRVVETQNYRVHSELPQPITSEIVEELERCHDEFTRRIGAFAPRREQQADADDKDGKYNVHLFVTQKGYEAFTGGGVPNSAGAFHPGKRVLCAYLEGQGHAEIKGTLRHEAFHQFAHEHFGPSLPVWVNEGLAQVFEFGVRVGSDLEMGQVPPGVLHEVQAAVRERRLVDFGEMITLDDKGWARYMADRNRGGALYAQAWAMTHFLVYAADAAGRPLYRPRFNEFLKTVAEGEPGLRAFREHFGTNLDGFRDRFERYILALGPTQPAETLDHQDVLAKMIILLHQRGTDFDRVEAFREYVRRYGIVLHRTRNNVTWTTDPDPGVYFLDTRGRPLEGRRLRFYPDPTGELPQLIRRPGDGVVYRTRFYRLDERLLHETTCERE